MRRLVAGIFVALVLLSAPSDVAAALAFQRLSDDAARGNRTDAELAQAVERAKQQPWFHALAPPPRGDWFMYADAEHNLYTVSEPQFRRYPRGFFPDLESWLLVGPRR